MKRFITILTIIIGFCSCVKDEELKLSAVSDKIVVHSYLSTTDTIISVNVSYSFPVDANAPYFDEDKKYIISDAVVELSSPNQTIVLPYQPDRYRYEVPANVFPIEAGTTYKLHVKTKDGNEVRAECKVPRPIYDFVYNIDENIVDSYRDPYTGEEWSYTYTQLTMEWRSQDASYFMYSEKYNCISNDSVYCNEFPVSTYPITVYKEGDLYKSRQQISSSSFNGDKIIIVIDAVDKNYEKYYKWREQTSFQNPFSQPVVTFTNIENGLGVFGAFTRIEIEIE